MREKGLTRMILEPLAIAVALACLARSVVRIYSIPSASMSPTLRVGDAILVTPYRYDTPARGDVVVFRSPQAEGEVMVKRIVAVPGDLIETRTGRIRIGGHALPEPYVMRQAASGSIAPQIVPPDRYFVMGDNRADSRDSRTWGPVYRPLILGRARMVLPIRHIFKWID